MKLHQILAIATVLAIIATFLGILGIAYGLETPKSMFGITCNATKFLGLATAVTWAIGKVARAVL